MGGPCFIKEGKKKILGPGCTDNFQFCRFNYPIGSDKMWHSAEQCYQALKYLPESLGFKTIYDATPFSTESESAHGMRVWSLGQRYQIDEPEWEGKKVEFMYLVNVAKYASSAALQEELLSTGDAPIIGGPSTWEWPKWNGLIQMLIRKKLQLGVDLNTITQVTMEEFENL